MKKLIIMIAWILVITGYIPHTHTFWRSHRKSNKTHLKKSIDTTAIALHMDAEDAVDQTPSDQQHDALEEVALETEQEPVQQEATGDALVESEEETPEVNVAQENEEPFVQPARPATQPEQAPARQEKTMEREQSNQEESAAQEQLPSANVIQEPALTGDREFDQRSKEKDIADLVDYGISFLKNHTEDEAFTAFLYDKRFRKGELYLFVYDNKGTCLVNQQEELIWQNLTNLKDTYGNPIVQNMIDRAHAGGGWVIYQWRNATKKSYVRELHKADKSYIIGAGYYPQSKEDAVVTLVKGAVSVFNQTIKEGRPKEEAFSTFSYPLGKFVFGDLYLYALDFHGLQLAHGDLPGIIGTNAWNYRDSAGNLVNQNIVARLKDTDLGTGIWIEYLSKNALKRTYAEKVVDAQGKYYFIACGYYPDADRNQVANLVQRGYRYLKGNGESQAVRAFTERSDNSFRYGDLFLVLFDMEGMCIANGGNASLVGTNMYNVQDEDGLYYVREIIKKAKDGGGWVDYKDKNAFRSTYVEKVNLGVKDFVITCGLYPITKRETMIQLTKSGADYLKNHEPDESFRAFTKEGGKFIRGDIHLFVVDASGVCFVDGDNFERIWKNMLNMRDDTGKAYVNVMINSAQRGSGIVTYNLNGATKVNFIEPVDKGGKRYVVTSGFYL